MYAAKLKLGLQKDGVEGSPAWERELDKDWEAESSADPFQGSIEFTAGNPRVEHTTGVVHLYRPIPENEPSVTPALPVCDLS